MANTISQQEHERHKRRRARQWLGLAICLLVLIGAFTVISAAVGGVAILFDDTDEKLEYEQRLQALVMLDPLPFDDLDQADPALLKEAAIWAAVSTAQSSATGLDAYERDGKRIVSTFIDEPQGKYIKGERSPSGTILFDFVTSEYPRPDTPEGWTLLRESLRADAATTTRRTRLHTFPD